MGMGMTENWSDWILQKKKNTTALPLPALSLCFGKQTTCISWMRHIRLTTAGSRNLACAWHFMHTISMNGTETEAQLAYSSETETVSLSVHVWLCNPMDCSLPGSSVHGIFQASILEWIAFPFSRASSWPGIKLGSPTLQADSLSSEPPGKPV